MISACIWIWYFNDSIVDSEIRLWFVTLRYFIWNLSLIITSKISIYYINNNQLLILTILHGVKKKSSSLNVLHTIHEMQLLQYKSSKYHRKSLTSMYNIPSNSMLQILNDPPNEFIKTF